MSLQGINPAPNLTSLNEIITDIASTSGSLDTIYVTDGVGAYEQRHPETNALLFSVPTVNNLVIAPGTITQLIVTLIENDGLGIIDFGANNKQFLNSKTNIIGYKIDFKDEIGKVNPTSITIGASGANSVIQVISKNKL